MSTITIQEIQLEKYKFRNNFGIPTRKSPNVCGGLVLGILKNEKLIAVGIFKTFDRYKKFETLKFKEESHESRFIENILKNSSRKYVGELVWIGWKKGPLNPILKSFCGHIPYRGLFVISSKKIEEENFREAQCNITGVYKFIYLITPEWKKSWATKEDIDKYTAELEGTEYNYTCEEWRTQLKDILNAHKLELVKVNPKKFNTNFKYVFTTPKLFSYYLTREDAEVYALGNSQNPELNGLMVLGACDRKFYTGHPALAQRLQRGYQVHLLSNSLEYIYILFLKALIKILEYRGKTFIMMISKDALNILENLNIKKYSEDGNYVLCGMDSLQSCYLKRILDLYCKY